MRRARAAAAAGQAHPAPRPLAAALARPELAAAGHDRLPDGPSLTGPGEPPRPLSALVGREAEVQTARRLVREDGVRLLTVTGPGGVGKTRLALEAAERLRPAFAGGVTFVDLTRVDAAAHVLPAIARALGVREGAGAPVGERLARVLHHDQRLLLLDNAEHVLEAGPELGRLLEACPGVVAIVTSREPLRLRGEHELPLAPLALPDPAAGPAGLAGAPAVVLFARRAGAVDPGFRLDDRSAPAVAELCRRLDGLPLAIELAAARTKVLPPDLLLERLAGWLDLAARERDVPARHRTLRATFAWSDALLTAGERDLFQRVSVCVGGFDLDAAAALAGGDALDALTSLVEKSLAVRLPAGDAPPGAALRFRLLEPVREYALRRLAEEGKEAAARAGHARHFAAAAAATAERLQGPGQGGALRALEADRDNLRAALRWLLDHGEAEAVARLGGALWLFWGITGDLREGGAWMAEALAQGAGLTPAARAGALLVTGTAALQARAAGTGLEQVEESRRLFEAAGDARRAALALLFVGRADEARRRFRALGEAAGEALALTVLAEEALLDGALDRAQETYEASLACARAAQDVRAVAHALDGLGLVALHRGQPERARPLLVESITLCLRLGHAGGLWYPLLDLAAAAQLLGDPVRAARLFGAAEALRLRQGADVPPEHRSVHQRTEAALRARLGDGPFAAAAAAGGGLDPAGVAAEVRAAEPAPPAARREPDAAAREALTARELEVAALIGQGMTSKEIAAVLVITERTADTHAERIRGKLGLRSRAEIAAWAVRHGLPAASRSG